MPPDEKELLFQKMEALFYSERGVLIKTFREKSEAAVFYQDS